MSVPAVPGVVESFVANVAVGLARMVGFWLWGQLVHLGLDRFFTQDQVNSTLSWVIATALTAVVYVVIRWLESHRSWWGWLLLAPRSPSFADARTVQGTAVQ